MLTDARTGEQREVDIVIETSAGIHPLTVGIEVIEHTRPASSTWIEQIAKKHEDLPIDKTIAVSLSGYYNPALLKARAYKIDALTLEEASGVDWPTAIHRMNAFKFSAFVLPQLSEVTVMMTDESSIATFADSAPGDFELHDPEDRSRGKIRYLVENLLCDPNLIAKLESEAFTDASTIVESMIRLRPGHHIHGPDGREHGVQSIMFKAQCRKTEVEADVLKGTYRDRVVTMASGLVLGREMQVVFFQEQGASDVAVAVRWKKL